MFSKSDVSAKLDEHIQHLLDKPELTLEDYSILRQKLEDYPVDKGNDWLLIMLIILIFDGFKTEH